MTFCFSEFLGDSVFDAPDPIGTGRPAQQQQQGMMAPGGNAFGLQNLAQNLSHYRCPDNPATMHQADSSLDLVPANPQAANMQVTQGLIHPQQQLQNPAQGQTQALGLQSQQGVVPGGNMMLMVSQQGTHIIAAPVNTADIGAPQQQNIPPQIQQHALPDTSGDVQQQKVVEHKVKKTEELEDTEDTESSDEKSDAGASKKSSKSSKEGGSKGNKSRSGSCSLDK